jgi:GNAT superfamily N-acetyltransferase
LMVSPRVELFRAGWDDVKVLSHVVAAAFHDLAPSGWLISDVGERSAIFPAYFQISVEMALAGGVVFTDADRTSAALWLDVRAGRDAPFTDYDDRLAGAVGPHVERFRAFDRLLEERQPTGVGHYQHLLMLAVRPDRQRRGIGSALLAGSHRLLAAEGIAAFLEASDMGTRGLYLRHGYVDRGAPIQIPGGACMYPMWRTPTAGS